MNNLNLTVVDVGNHPLIGKKILFTPTYPPNYSGSYLSVADSYQFIADQNGVITGSVVPGVYTITISNPLPATNCYLIFTDTSSSLYSGSYQTGSTQGVYFDLMNLVEQPFAVKKVVLTSPLGYPVMFNGTLVAMASTSSITDNNGVVTFPTLIPGDYLWQAIGKVTTSGYISLPPWPPPPTP